MRSKPLRTMLMLGVASIVVVAYPPDVRKATTLVIKSPLPASTLPASSLQSNDETEWEDPDDCCSTPYFKFTHENIEESKVHSWYIESREQWIKNNPEDFKRLGEVRYFGEKILKIPNFHCGVEKNGCDEAPSCETILRKTEKFLRGEDGNNDVTREEINSLARRRYFVVKEWQNIGRYLHILDADLGKAQTDLNGRVPLIIRRFTSQVEPTEDIERKVRRHVWDMSWSLVSLGLGTMFDLKIGDKEKDPTAWGKFFNPMSAIGWTMSWTKTFTESGAETAGRLEFLDRAGLEAAAGSTTSTGRLHLVQSYASDLFGQYQIDENEGNTANMGDYTSLALRSARRALKVFAKHLFSGSLDVTTDKRTPALSFLMTADAQRNLEESEENIAREDNLAQFFEKDAIALVYGSQQCYAACKLEKSIAKVDESCPSPKLNYETPFCSREPPYEVCLTKCWKMKSGKWENSDLYGVEWLKEYNTNVTDLISDAIAEQRHRGSWGQTASHQDKVLDKVFQLGETRGIGDTMPLCASEYIDLNKKDGFPCQCGSWDSNGTKIFMEKVGLVPSNTDWRSTPNWKTMTKVCPQYLANRLPAARFKLFCDLNIGFPRTDRGAYSGPGRWDFRMEKDPLCDKIVPQLMGKTDIAASQWFCESSDLREDLQRHERIYPNNMPGVWNHWDLCQWFKKRNYEKRWDS